MTPDTGQHWHSEAFDDHNHDRDDVEVQETAVYDGRWHYHEEVSR